MEPQPQNDQPIDNPNLTLARADFDSQALSQQSWDLMSINGGRRQSAEPDMRINNTSQSFSPFNNLSSLNGYNFDNSMPYYRQASNGPSPFFNMSRSPDQQSFPYRVSPTPGRNQLQAELEDQEDQDEDDQADQAGFEGPDVDDQDRRREADERTRPHYSDRNVVVVRPGESIQQALDKAPDGSVVRVMPGVYREIIEIKRDNVTLEGDGQAVFDMSGRRVSEGVIRLKNRNNVTISGFEIRNVSGSEDPTGIQVEGAGNNIKILNCNIHHIASDRNAHAINVVGTSSRPITGLVIEGNKIHDLRLGSSEAVTINGNIDGFRVIRNVVRNSNNIGIDVTGGYGVAPREFDRARNGVIADNQVSDIDSRSNPAYRGRMAAAGIYVDGGVNVVIERNRVWRANYGIELASEKRGWNTENITVRNNILSNNHMAGLSMGGSTQANGGVIGSVIENNRFIDNATEKGGANSEIWLQSNVANNVIRSNEFRARAGVRLVYGMERNPNNRIDATSSRTGLSRLKN